MMTIYLCFYFCGCSSPHALKLLAHDFHNYQLMDFNFLILSFKISLYKYVQKLWKSLHLFPLPFTLPGAAMGTLSWSPLYVFASMGIFVSQTMNRIRLFILFCSQLFFISTDVLEFACQAHAGPSQLFSDITLYSVVWIHGNLFDCSLLISI